MSTLRISNIEAKSVPASATIDEKVKITNSSGDTLVFLDGKTSGITTVGINTTDGNITFDANSNVVVTGIITATRFSGQITPTSLEIGSNIKLGNAGVITATSFVGSGANLTSLPSQLTINNNANNRIITGSGSANTLEGESTLTYDGDGLLSMTSSSGPAELTLVAPSANDSGIYFNDGSNDGAITYDHSTRNMNFRANSQTKFRIEGDTKTLKLQRAPSSDVDIVLARAQRWGYSNSWQGLIIGNPAVGNMSSLFLNYDPSSNTSGSFAGDGREIVVRKNAKIIVPNNADNNFFNAIEFNCGGSRDDGVSRFRQGIIVSNDSADANVLDDYEEGSWTPVPEFGGNLVGASYSIDACVYTKIGRTVTVKGNINFSNRGSSNGGFKLSGLPFTSSAGSYSHFCGSAIVFFGPNADGSMNTFASGTQVRFRMHNEAHANAEPQEADFDNDTKIMFSMTYFI